MVLSVTAPTVVRPRGSEQVNQTCNNGVIAVINQVDRVADLRNPVYC